MQRALLLMAVVLAATVGCSLDSGGTAGGPTSLDEDTGSIAADSSVQEDTAGDPDTMVSVDSAPASDAPVDDTIAPDTTVADTAKPDTAVADTAKPDTAVADTAKPDTTAVDTAMPDTTMPDTTVVDTAVPDTAMPDTKPLDMGTTCTEMNAVVFGGHCYFPIAAGDWGAVRSVCVAAGAHLASITSGAEQSAVEKIGSGDRWVGLVLGATATWAWQGGEALSYTHWDSGEPNKTGNCGRFSGSGQWRDTDCDDSNPAICERDSL